MVTLDHVNLSVNNLEQSIQWYNKTFGFEVVEKADHKGTPYAIIRNQENMICMYEYPDKATPNESQTHKIYHFGLRVRDQKQWEAHIEKANIELDHVWDYPHSKSWYLFDPSGHEIEVCYWHNDTIQF